MLLADFKKFILFRVEQSIVTAGWFKMVLKLIFIYLNLQLYASAFEAPNRRLEQNKYECPSKYTKMGSNKNNLCLRYLHKFLVGKYFRGNVSTKILETFKHLIYLQKNT